MEDISEQMQSSFQGDVEIELPLEHEDASPRFFTDDERRKIQEKGCRIFRFEEKPETDSIENYIRDKSLGLLGKYTVDRLAVQWPQNCDLALLPGIQLDSSNNKNYMENVLQMLSLKDDFGKKYQGTEAVMGTLVQYLAINYNAKISGSDLFRPLMVRTSSTVEQGKKGPGNYVFLHGDVVDIWDQNVKDEHLVVAPILQKPK